MLTVFFFTFGALVGSYLNVLILRLPKEEDTIFTPSHCPVCKKNLHWYMNIPILSYTFFRGKCHYCKAKISPQYPLIELITTLMAIIIKPKYLDFDSFYFFFFYFSIFCVFLVHFIIDLRHKILPDSLNVYLLFTFAAYAFFYKTFMFSILGFLIGLLFPLSVAYIFYKLKGVEGLGGGDIKLFAVLGVLLGPVGILQNLFLSCFLGSIVGIFLIVSKVMGKDEGIPFGPSILIVASFQIYFPKVFERFTQFINFSF